MKINLVYCHRLPHRSFFWRGKQFPICARCTGIHLGYFAFPFFLFDLVKVKILWAIILIIPTCIDGVTQLYFNRESNNFLRFTTGLISGIGIVALISIIGQFIGQQILLLIK